MAILLVTLLAGCAQSGADDDVPDVADDPLAALSAKSRLVAAGPKTMVSLPGQMASEFWVERDPSDPMRLIVGRLEFLQTNDWGCYFARSDDGGASWTELPRPWTGTSSDPWVAWAPDGTVHVICNTSHHARSIDAGGSWQDLGAPDTPGNDRPAIHVDSGGRLLHCSTRPSTNEGPTIVYSDDHGDTWATSPFTAHAEHWEDTMCNTMEEGPGGVLYTALGISTFRLAVSTDRGASWTETVEIPIEDPRRYDSTQVVPTHREGNMDPGFAVSPATGHLFASMTQYDTAANLGLGAFHAELHRSTDQGASFERLAWPEAPAECTRCDVTRPLVHVSDDGALAALWRTSEMGLPFQTWFAVSTDEGETWLPPMLLSTEAPFQTAVPTRSIDGADHYWNMASTPEGFVAFWIDRTADGVSGLWTQRLRLE